MRGLSLWVPLAAVAFLVGSSTVAGATVPEQAVAAGSTQQQQPAVLSYGPAVDIRPDSVATDTEADLGEQFGPTTGAEVAIIGAAAWHDAGIDGSGVTIGVIDFFDARLYWNVAEHGPLPIAGVSAACFRYGADCTSAFFDGIDDGGEDHGVAVVETIRDVAPGATILIGQAVTVADYRLLVDWFIAHDVDIISRSLGSRYDGPGDGRGPLDDVADDAVARGVLWVNSAGNNGHGQYYRHQVRLAGGRVAFGPSGSETFLRFAGCVSLGGVRWANDWDSNALQRTDYDVFLWDSPTGDPAAGTVIASSQVRQQLGAPPIESIDDSHCPTVGSTLYLEVRWLGGSIAGDILEILDYGAGISDFTSDAGSASVSVVDSTNPGVVAVGAIDPAGSGTLANYSSQGPSTDGRTLPDLVAPANFDSTVLGRFAGTSAAAAVTTGSAALLRDAGLAGDPNTLADLVRHVTVDRGPPGPDNRYGHGELRLPDPPTGIGVDSTPARFVALPRPTRALDTRPETAVGPGALIGRLERGAILDVPITGAVGVPTAGVTAVAVNIVSVDADRSSFVQAFPTNQAQLGVYSNVNVDAPGQTRANFAIIPIGDNGMISVYSVAAGHIVVDVLGWFEATDGAVSAGRFIEFGNAERLIDTRVDAGGISLGSGQVRDIPMPAGVPAAQVEALVVTVTAAAPTAPGWLQAFPTGRPESIGRTSTVNTPAGGAVANTAIVPVFGGGISVTGFFAGGGASHVIVDAIGYITSSANPSATSGRFVGIVPGRAFDSRISGDAPLDEQPITLDASDAAGVSIPSSASAVVWNAAVVDARRSGFLRVWSTAAPEPETSSLNWSAVGEIRAGAVISAVDQGRARFGVDDGDRDLPGPVTEIIVDVFGYFT